MGLKEDEQAFHQFGHEAKVQLVNGIRWHVIMGVAIERGISDHHCFETLVPERSVVAEPYRRNRPASERNG